MSEVFLLVLFLIINTDPDIDEALNHDTLLANPVQCETGPLYDFALKHLSKSLDLYDFDKSDTKYGFSFRTNLLWVRWAYIGSREFPSSEDSGRFPLDQVTQDHVTFNLECQNHLQTRIQLHGPHSEPEHLLQWLDAFKWHERVYYKLLFIKQQDSSGNLYCKRQALTELRDLLGEDSYVIGKIPPHVPPAYFKGIK